MRQSRRPNSRPMSSAHKKVIVRRFTGETLPGYLPLSAFVRNRSIDLLDLSGRVITLSLNDIKHICYVRDFNLTDTLNPERLIRRTFLARPRTEGLWLRITFRGGDLLEGLAPPSTPPSPTTSSTTPASSSPPPTSAPTPSASTSPAHSIAEPHPPRSNHHPLQKKRNPPPPHPAPQARPLQHRPPTQHPAQLSSEDLRQTKANDEPSELLASRQ